MLKPNTSEQITPIPVGTYPCEIITAEAAVSKNNEGMIVAEVRVVDPRSGKPQDIKTWIMTEGKGSKSFDNLLRAVGLGELADQYKRGEGPDFDEKSLIGQRPAVTIKHEEYMGDMSHKIGRFLPATPAA